jgi:hypothetical protein
MCVHLLVFMWYKVNYINVTVVYYITVDIPLAQYIKSAQSTQQFVIVCVCVCVCVCVTTTIL